MDSRNCGYCKNCAVGNYDACTSFQPSASAEPDQSKCTVCRNSAGVGMTVCDACHASMGMATRALGASQTERIAGMLDGYVESIKEHGGTMLERWHYIPEIEDAAESLRAALQPSFPPPVTAAREQEASATGAEPAAYRYKDVRGHWRYVGAPLSEGWALPTNLSFEPLYATPTSATGAEPAEGMRRAWEIVNAMIVPGQLQGNGCDETAQRNGLILAANAILAATPTTSTTGKVDVEQMLRDCVPGGSSCDPQAICDDIRNWFANGGNDAK